MLHGIITQINIYLTLILAYGFSVTLAGAAKAWIAKKMGDSTAEYAGFLTIDPLIHVDLVGLIVLLLTGFGWGRTIPVNAANIREPHRSAKLLTIYYSTTLMHILMCIIMMLMFASMRNSFLMGSVSGKMILTIMETTVSVNAFLAMLRFIQASMELIFMHAVELHPEYAHYIELGALIGSLLLMLFLGRQMQLFFLHLSIFLTGFLKTAFLTFFSWI